MLKQCWFWCHQWGKWADVQELTYHPRVGDTSAIVAVFIVQHRRCARCNMLQARRVKQ